MKRNAEEEQNLLYRNLLHNVHAEQRNFKLAVSTTDGCFFFNTDDGFVRLHKSHLVNVLYITAVSAQGKCRAERWIDGGDLAEEERGCDGYFEAGVNCSAGSDFI